MIEIERRFLVAELPDPLPEGDLIVQGYLMTSPAAVRVRRRGDAHTFTIKIGRGVSRTEIERSISADEFDALWNVATELRIEKVRHLVPLFESHLVAELDLFSGALHGHRLVEVEFHSDGEAARFEPPAWFGRDVTDDIRYTNAALARHGWPTESE